MTIDAPAVDVVRRAVWIDGDPDADREVNSRLNELIAAGTALANDQAPNAPAAVAHEAIIRFVAFMFTGPLPIETSYPAIWRRTGAAGLLAPWTVRRAGKIG